MSDELTDGFSRIAERLRDLTRHHSDPQRSLRELASVPPQQLRRAILDAGESPEAAERLVDGVAARFPTDALVGRLGARMPALARLRALNPDTELLHVDLSRGSSALATIDMSGMDEQQADAAVSELRAGQRMLSLAGTVGDAELLLAAGYTDSLQVARTSSRALAAKTGMDPLVAQAYQRRAKEGVDGLTATVGGLLELINGGFDTIALNNMPPDLSDQLRDLPGYSQLFGSQAFCDCGHCQSVLGPAAYFVDLMAWVEDTVDDYFTGKPSHPLRLYTRRPDLWTVPLTCENTDGLIPVLQIVNEVLENYLATDQGFTGDLDDRAAVTRKVYRDLLSNAVESPRSPFFQPLARITAYLRQLEVTLSDVAEIVGVPQTTATAAALEMAWREYEIATEINQDLTRLQAIFGLPLAFGEPGIFVPIDVQDMVAATRVDRDTLGRLIKSRFVTGAGAGVRIVPEKTNQDSVQNDIERVRGLTPDALDHLNRLTRLAKHVPWTVRELDLMLSHLGISGGDMVEIAGLAGPLRLHRQRELSVEEICALTGPMPTLPVDDRPSMFARLFNPAPFVDRDGPYPQDATVFVHPALRDPGPATTASHRERLLAALGVTDETLLVLLRELAGPLGADPAAAMESDRGFPLTRHNLSLLWRHVRAASLVGLSVVNLLRLIRLNAIGNGYLANASDVDHLLETVDIVRGSGRSLDDLDVITGRVPRDPGKYPDARTVAERVIEQVAAEQAMTFTDTVFVTLPDVSEEISRLVVAANPTVIVASTVTGRLRLAPGADFALPLVVPAAVMSLVTPAEARSVLLDYAPDRVLASRLAGPLGVSPAAIAELAGIAGVQLASTTRTLALHGLAPVDSIVELIEALIPVGVLFADPAYDAAALAFVGAQPELFDLTDVRAITLDGVRAVADYARLATIPEPARFTAAELRTILASFDAQSFSYHGADLALLARVVGTEPGMLTTLLSAVVLNRLAPTALRRLADAVAFAQRLGVGGDTLTQLLDPDYDQLQRGADALLAALRARYPQSQWAERIAPVEESVRAQERDALVDHLLHSAFPQFGAARDLYEYFLLDVEAGGCATTSRVVAATNSLQLYVHRILMNLEQDRRALDDPARLAIPPDAVDGAQWEWRQNYRVWEANRKVFLWPENYMDPDLRFGKTPPFMEVESGLLQRPIDEQSVLDAYSGYLAGIEELAGLQYAGSFHEKNPTAKTDVLHLFGATRTDPPVFYHRMIENAHFGVTAGGKPTVWKPWQKVDLQIGARKVAPIVANGRLHVFWTEYATKAQNKVVDGNSTFDRYLHATTVKYAMLRMDGRWTAPQKLSLMNTPPFVGDGIVDDQVWVQIPIARYNTENIDAVMNRGPVDSYTLRGFNWDQVYPSVTAGGSLLLSLFGFQVSQYVDLFARRLAGAQHPVLRPGRPLIILKNPGGDRELYRTAGDVGYARSTQLLDRKRLSNVLPPPWPILNTLEAQVNRTRPLLVLGYPGFEIAKSVDLVNGSPEDAFISTRGDDIYYLQGSVGAANVLRRAGTTLGPQMSRTLFTEGLDTLLSLDNQKELREPGPSTSVLWDIDNRIRVGEIDFDGAFGDYFREVFLHIPFLIANHLNSQQRYAAAQRWYHYVFNPMAVDRADPSLTTEQRVKAERDRVWRYLELRGLDLPKLRQILTDPLAIDAYHKDPFNPFAIAKVRPTAMQKALVGKYIDNLLDWADSLFTQFTRESINEAMMLYQVAAEILGPRPAKLGGCGEDIGVPRTYQYIKSLLNSGSEFLAEVETWVLARVGVATAAQPLTEAPSAFDEPTLVMVDSEPEPDHADENVMRLHRDPELADERVTAELNQPLRAAIGNGDGLSRANAWRETQIGRWDNSGRGRFVRDLPGRGTHGDFGWSLVRQISPVFCVPRNPELLRHWDRVEDRLFKIRHCQDINGVKRELSLFAPEIDPMALVRAAAAGLSMDDVLGAGSAVVPPYRFSYLLEKAKAQASTVQSLGSGLLSALEKKDAEELIRLRAVHERTILDLTTRTRQWEIDTAIAAVSALEQQETAATYRRDYYRTLHATGLIGPEQVHNDAVLTASSLNAAAGLIDTIAGIAYLIPQLGSPFAMKYGGQEVGNSANAWAMVIKDAAGVADAVGDAAKMLAEYTRRSDEWKHQAQVAQHELDVTNRHLAGARIQQKIAERAMELHERAIAQAQEVHDFYGSKFTALGLYTHLSAKLQELHRNAYTNAYAMARLAEQAYRFERGAQAPTVLAPSYWDSSRAGLLAGERLLTDLQNLERRFIETDHRRLEVDQSFSLAQISPLALAALRETGACDFTLPEGVFDLFYPGHFRRRIRSVRLTIPAVTGPYVNVSATLTLRQSWLRAKPQLGSDPQAWAEVPAQRSASIATSSARQDGGVFELSFRDDRYLPFEGAGAVSRWELSLPRTFRPFDYQTISDVIVHIAYTADAHDGLRTQVETGNAAIEGSLRHHLSQHSRGRIFSLRHDFPGQLQRLLTAPAGSPVQIGIGPEHLPFLLQGMPLQVVAARLAVVPVGTLNIDDIRLRLNNVPLDAPSTTVTVGGRKAVDAATAVGTAVVNVHTLSVVAPAAGATAVGPNTVHDILLYLEYRAQ